MPLIAHNGLPSFERLRQEGQTVLAPERAATQDIRALHIGLLNLMPDAALEATERQFFRLIGDSNKIAQLHVRPFTVPELERGAEAKAHIAKYYDTFETLKAEGLDALIVTGANLENDVFETLPFWDSLQEIMDWAWDNVASTITACMATHFVMHFRHGQVRTRLPDKRLGVFKSRVRERSHPIVQGMNTVFDVPHSRYSELSWAQFEQAGMRILVNSFEGGVHMAASRDGFRLLCFQGHQEYDTVSLLKEFRRDMLLQAQGQMETVPFPLHYFSSEAMEIIERWKQNPDPENFPESEIIPHIENTWRDSARAIIGNWIGKVYQTTNVDRRLQYMDGIDPENPLGL